MIIKLKIIYFILLASSLAKCKLLTPQLFGNTDSVSKCLFRRVLMNNK